MVFVFIILNWIFVLMNTSTMVPYTGTSRGGNWSSIEMSLRSAREKPAIIFGKRRAVFGKRKKNPQ